MKQCFSFDDVLISPAYSNVLPSETVLYTRLSKKLSLKIPVLSSAMDKVTESKTAIAMAMNGGLGIIHRNLSPEVQSKEVEKVKNFIISKEKLENALVDDNHKLIVGAAIGTNDYNRLDLLLKAGVDVIVIDTAHGHSQKVTDAVKEVKQIIGDKTLIAGNVATAEAAIKLIVYGADCIKVGVGPGSICTTRIVTGVGIPQLSAIMNVAEVCNKFHIPLIADGGIRNPGDIAKAIAGGAHAVMLGNLLAGCDESPGELITHSDGLQYKTYRGMGSLKAMLSGSAERYFQSTAKKLIPEGVEGLVQYKGSTENILNELTGGLRSAMGYTGNKTIEEMRRNCSFVQITNASILQSHPHNLTNISNK